VSLEEVDLKNRGFTMTEMLVVIALIVLMIAMAVPTFNFITGNRSVNGAQNQISAYLARARTEAIGLQEVRGVFFYKDLRTDRTALAMVREVPRPPSGAPHTIPSGLVPEVSIFVDLVPDTEAVLLPAGVEAQVLDDAALNTATSPPRREDDGYIGYNRFNRGNDNSGPDLDPLTPYGGVILFDASGKLIYRTYAFKTYSGGASPGTARATAMGDLLYRPSGALRTIDHVDGGGNILSGCHDVVPKYTSPSTGEVRPPRSAVAIALFEKEPYENRPRNPAQQDTTPFTDREIDPNDTIYGTTQAHSEAEEERWIDENAVQLLVNRYNGTLVRAQ
jgi:prepilin-type N-terminal cleavage/methylation domain-containing protein